MAVAIALQAAENSGSVRLLGISKWVCHKCALQEDIFGLHFGCSNADNKVGE